MMYSNKKLYHTRQLDSLLRFFKAHPSECFSARQIIENDAFDMGEATVYRLLARLTADGMLKRFASSKGATYQYNALAQHGGHFHLTCLGCGETVCVDCDFMDGMEQHIQNEHAFLIDNTKTTLYGTCGKCGGCDVRP